MLISSSTISLEFRRRSASGADAAASLRGGDSARCARAIEGQRAPMACGSPQACSTAATTGAAWRGCIASAQAANVPLLATNEVLYHHPARRPLQDVLTCIREKTTIEAIGRRLEANAERYLKPAHEMARLFRDLPEAIAETMRFAEPHLVLARTSSNTSIPTSRCRRARPRSSIWRT